MHLYILVHQKMNKFSSKYFSYFPIFGLGLYVIIFTIAVLDYPGGSDNYPNATTGYSFFHNFLSDAMNPITQGGALNEARFMAVISHLILSLSMISFFYILPKIFDVKNKNTKLITVFGMASMIALMFMYTEYHDLIVTITGVLGAIALIPFFIELRSFKNKGLKRIAYLCYTLSIIVFLIFETKIGIYYLPIIQKITFFADSYWVIWSCLFVIKKNKATLNIA